MVRFGLFRAFSVVGAMGVCLVVLSGCVGNGGPVVSSSAPVEVSVEPSVVSVSPSVSMSEEERLLAMIPDAARGDSLMAAEAMAKFFIETRPIMFQDGNVDLFDFLCLPASVFCSSTLETMEERRATSMLQVGGDVEISAELGLSVLDTSSEDTTTALVQFDFTEAPLSHVDAEGNELRASEGGVYTASVALRHVDGIWRIHGVEVLRR